MDHCFYEKKNRAISLRKSQDISLARASAFNRIVVEACFTKYSEIVKKNHKLGPELMYNVDERAFYSS
jgi:hypothetical protein